MPKQSTTKNQSRARAKTPTIRKKETPKKKSAARASRRASEASDSAKKKLRALKTEGKLNHSVASLETKEKPNRRDAQGKTKKVEASPEKVESAASVAPPPAQETKQKPAARKKERESENGASKTAKSISETKSAANLSADEIEPAIDFAEDLEDAKEAMDAKPLEQSEASEGDETEEEIAIELPKELELKDEKPSSREEDYALIDIIRGGDRYKQEQAFKKLLSKYRGQIYNLILKIVHNPNEVEDLVQESFSKAFNSIANFNKEFAFSTWLYRIATNSSIDFLRKRRLKTFSIDSPIKTKDDEFTVEIPDSSDEPEKNVIQSQRDALVREAIRQLPPKYRTVIEMRHLQELSYEEIADELKIPLGTVKAHIFRAREMLYKMLRDKLRSY